MDPNNNNSNSSYYDDASSVKASSTVGMQDKDFILELLCWHNEYRQVEKRLYNIHNLFLSISWRGNNKL